MKASYKKHILQFTFEAGTSRGTLTKKTSFFLILRDKHNLGVGEVSIIPNLSLDSDEKALEKKLQELVSLLNNGYQINDAFLNGYPALQFGWEQAKKSLEGETPFHIFPGTPFFKEQQPIPINGLIWMGDKDFQSKQIKKKLAEGFSCLKLKIGALDFEKELSLLKAIRKRFGKDDLELRVDANGAFSPESALDKLDQLSRFHLHSIEQPIQQGQWENMRYLCEKTPIPIALDEELIGIPTAQKESLLASTKPHYIILKPSLLGGFAMAEEWIKLAEKKKIGWWATSALESNVGLNAIAQWTAHQKVSVPQGLGTGGLYSNNIPSPLHVENGGIYYLPDKKRWETKLLFS